MKRIRNVQHDDNAATLAMHSNTETQTALPSATLEVTRGAPASAGTITPKKGKA